jgi:hypothetical protein
MPFARQSVESVSGIPERAFEWEASRPVSWRCCGASLLLHLLALLPWLPAGQPAGPPKELRAQAIFRPAPGEAPAPRVARLVPVPANPVPLPEPGVAAERVHVDTATIQLSFAPDARGEAPQMVQSQHGVLALLDRDDASLTRYLLEPPDWRPRESVRDVSLYFEIRMSPPEKWQVFRDAARRDGIDLDRYRACALFEPSFQRCIKQAILEWAANNPNRSGNVTSAKLAIAAGRPCGVEVIEVSFASR